MFFRRRKKKQKQKQKQEVDLKLVFDAERRRQHEEFLRKRALYQQAMLSLSAYGAWAHPADLN
ncbi:MAG: hypothetical protein K8I27_12155 [Planctomycetes bacterium]|nr:hypothetical protein [Planctomycetota bacterium]